VNVFAYSTGAWRMLSWGDVTHLAGDEITVYRGSAA
jgi:hypothetical protein